MKPCNESEIVGLDATYRKYYLKGYEAAEKEHKYHLKKIRAEIEQAADKQFQIAMGVADLNERYAHIQMENAYRHSLSVIDKYRVESDGIKLSKEDRTMINDVSLADYVKENYIDKKSGK